MWRSYLQRTVSMASIHRSRKILSPPSQSTLFPPFTTSFQVDNTGDKMSMAENHQTRKFLSPPRLTLFTTSFNDDNNEDETLMAANKRTRKFISSPPRLTLFNPFTTSFEEDNDENKSLMVANRQNRRILSSPPRLTMFSDFTTSFKVDNGEDSRLMAATHRIRRIMAPLARLTMFSPYTTSFKDDNGEYQSLMLATHRSCRILPHPSRLTMFSTYTTSYKDDNNEYKRILSPPARLTMFSKFTTTVGDDKSDDKEKRLMATERSGGGEKESVISLAEVRKLMKLVNVEALKSKLGEEGKEVIGYSELLNTCQSMGVVRSIGEAVAYAQVLDEAGVVLLFRDKVYLHPDKVVELVRRSVPLALTPEDDPKREELQKLQERKEEIDRQAHRQVRMILWSGLGISVMQVGLFFRLTFWEFSWDVMEPIAFFTTASGLVVGYAYFMFTSKDPSYQDLKKTLFLSRQRKLFKKCQFDTHRFKELSNRCKNPLDKKQIDESLILEDV